MKIKQFEDKQLSHYSYAVLSECESEIVLIDPSRDIKPYLDYAVEMSAKITGVIETHPHADFVSGHFELHELTGATIYCSKLLGAAYPHKTFDEGESIVLGKIRLKALNTPGHSPDSISIVLEHDGKDKAVFTGDTLFIGDCGRPDLREKAGAITATREELSKQMYHSLREKLMVLDKDVVVYPAHGAGTLCGKSLKDANSSTIAVEIATNWSLQEMSEAEFVQQLIAEQPFVPAYFPYDVSVNKEGTYGVDKALAMVTVSEEAVVPEPGIVIIDTRSGAEFKKGYLKGAVNLQAGDKFETWLGSIVQPHEPFYLTAADKGTLTVLIRRIAKIGYEPFIKAAFVTSTGAEHFEVLDTDAFANNADVYTIIDVRNASEAKKNPIFGSAINIPLAELRERLREIPTDKPVVVHCAGGTRSAAGSSIIAGGLDGETKVFDLGEAVKKF